PPEGVGCEVVISNRVNVWIVWRRGAIAVDSVPATKRDAWRSLNIDAERFVGLTNDCVAHESSCCVQIAKRQLMESIARSWYGRKRMPAAERVAHQPRRHDRS